MLKLLPIGIVVLVILGLSGYFIYNSRSTTPAPTTANAPIPLPSAPALTTLQSQIEKPQSSEERIRLLEQSILELKAQLDTLNMTKITPSSTNNDTAIANLQTQVNLLKANSGKTTAPASTNQSTIYIPLGNSGSSQSLTWTTINDVQVALNPAMFPGYSSMQLEVMLEAYQGNGTASVQLYDLDDGIGIQGSSISTTSQNYTLVSSSTFTLPSGTKNYRLQLMTNTGYAASISMARLRVNF